MSIIKLCCVYLIIPILLSFGMIIFLQLPSYSGDVVVPRNYNTVTINRDEYGIPTIKSKTYRDVLYGLGYAQGQDRLWQIYIKKMFIAGRLSEVLGEKVLETDKFLRVLST